VDERRFPELKVFMNAPGEHHLEAYAQLVEADIRKGKPEDVVQRGGPNASGTQNLKAAFQGSTCEASCEGRFVVAVGEHWSDGLARQRWQLQWWGMKSGHGWRDIWCWDGDGKDVRVG
jgi:hypothetical protein